MRKFDGQDIFHVHTYRCGHAEKLRDEIYIQKAIEYGAGRISFTDHAPFPENPFGSRMLMEQLPEYILTLRGLKEKYSGVIDVRIGLEIEYLPSFKEYYHELRENSAIEILVLGQHFFEAEKGRYSLSDSEGKHVESEPHGIGRAIIQGMETGLFSVVAHPDRTFRKRREWTVELAQIAENIIKTARRTGTALEMNRKSERMKGQYWQEFWDMVPEEVNVITGWDIHSLRDMAHCLD